MNQRKLLASLAILLLLGQTAYCQDDIDPEDLLFMQQQEQKKETQAASNLRMKGQLSSQVHLLSQISQASPNVKISAVFPSYFGKESQKSLIDMQLVQGQTERVLVAIQNNGFEPIEVKNMTGAFYEEGLLGEKPNYVQNLTIDSYDGFVIEPQQTLSIAYEFFAFTSIPPKTYKLQLALFYCDTRFEYTSMVLNQHVNVLESDQSVGITGLFSLILSGGVLFLIGFIIYAKVQDRYFAGPDGKRKKGNGGLLSQLRDIISG